MTATKLLKEMTVREGWKSSKGEKNGSSLHIHPGAEVPARAATATQPSCPLKRTGELWVSS